MYPTPYDKVRLGALAELAAAFPDAVLGLSDHSLGNYTCLAAVALGARCWRSTSRPTRTGRVPTYRSPSTRPSWRTRAGFAGVHAAMGGSKGILVEEQPTIDFAYACVVSIRDIPRGRASDRENIWVKRPGTGRSRQLTSRVLGRTAARTCPRDRQLAWSDMTALGERSLDGGAPDRRRVHGQPGRVRPEVPDTARPDRDPRFQFRLVVGVRAPRGGLRRDDLRDRGGRVPGPRRGGIDVGHDMVVATAKAIGTGIPNLEEMLEGLRPDLFVVYGDRFESLRSDDLWHADGAPDSPHRGRRLHRGRRPRRLGAPRDDQTGPPPLHDQ